MYISTNSKLIILLQIFSGTDDSPNCIGGRGKDAGTGFTDAGTGFTDAVIDRTGRLGKAVGTVDRDGTTDVAVARAAAAAKRSRPPEEVDVSGLNVGRRPTL